MMHLRKFSLSGLSVISTSLEHRLHFFVCEWTFVKQKERIYLMQSPYCVTFKMSTFGVTRLYSRVCTVSRNLVSLEIERKQKIFDFVLLLKLLAHKLQWSLWDPRTKRLHVTLQITDCGWEFLVWWVMRWLPSRAFPLFHNANKGLVQRGVSLVLSFFRSLSYTHTHARSSPPQPADGPVSKPRLQSFVFRESVSRLSVEKLFISCVIRGRDEALRVCTMA